MIEIKCSKAQYNRILTNLTDCGMLINGRCVLGKSYTTCPGTNGSQPALNCRECLKKNIKHVDKGV